VKYEKGKNQIMKSVFSVAKKNENIMSGSGIKEQEAPRRRELLPGR